MAFSILLDESCLRSMDSQLREALLTWYFERPSAAVESDIKDIKAELPTTVVHTDGANKRITFPEFLAKGLIEPGDSICCKALKRDRRQGAEDFIGGAKVAADGSVEFQGQR